MTAYIGNPHGLHTANLTVKRSAADQDRTDLQGHHGSHPSGIHYKQAFLAVGRALPARGRDIPAPFDCTKEMFALTHLKIENSIWR